MPETFQPIAVQPPSKNMMLFRIRCFVDLQLLTIFKFLKPKLIAVSGSILDVGAGQAPWKDLLSQSAKYYGVDIQTAESFGMNLSNDIKYYDGKKIPYENNTFDYVLCVEVLEHVRDPMRFLVDIKRVLKENGNLILTIPWSARIHHIPNDYSRFSRFGLKVLLEDAGFSDVVIEERGTDIQVIANKITVFLISLLRLGKLLYVIPNYILAIFMLPICLFFLALANLALYFNYGSKDDPLGYGVTAVKNNRIN